MSEFDFILSLTQACAEVFMDVSVACSLLARQERLTPVFLHLLKDDSRWVKWTHKQMNGWIGGWMN